MGLVLGGLPLLSQGLGGCTTPGKATAAYTGNLMGPSMKAGHLLRQGIRMVPESATETDVVVVGGGISGLSAARWLSQNGVQHFQLLELEDEVGGNASASQYEHTACPWGAHYLPIPDASLTELMDFLQEADVVTGFAENGLPVYNERHLCFDPKERLYRDGYWQQGLMPRWGLSEEELQQVDRFTEQMDSLSEQKGSDMRWAFALPVDTSSADETFRSLDQLSMQQWLQEQGYTSASLLWYIDYCCRDDYATNLANTSAWAGLHYFASRRGQAANSDPDRVLTWPEGNFWMARQLRNPLINHIQSGAMVFAINREGNRIAVDYLDLSTNTAKRIWARSCIMATPQYVNDKLLTKLPEAQQRSTTGFTYAPWLVANVTLSSPPVGHGAPLSWDNVLFGSKSLGYVLANHQLLEVLHHKPVLTYYYPLADEDPAAARGRLYRQTYEELADSTLLELEKAHPALREQVESIDVWRWGHGMIRPVPGFVWGAERQEAQRPLAGKVFFAHSDLGSISVFEEAFYGGIRAAREAIISLQHEHA